MTIPHIPASEKPHELELKRAHASKISPRLQMLLETTLLPRVLCDLTRQYEGFHQNKLFDQLKDVRSLLYVGDEYLAYVHKQSPHYHIPYDTLGRLHVKDGNSVACDIGQDRCHGLLSVSPYIFASRHPHYGYIEEDVIKLWDVGTGNKVAQFITRGSHASCSLSADRFAIGSGDDILICNAHTGAHGSPLRSEEPQLITCMTKASEEMLASGTLGGIVRLWRWRTGMCERTFTPHTGPDGQIAKGSISFLAMSSQDQLLVLTGSNHFTRCNLKTGNRERVLTDVSLAKINAKPLSSSRFALHSFTKNLTIHIYDLQQLKPVTEIENLPILMRGFRSFDNTCIAVFCPCKDGFAWSGMDGISIWEDPYAAE